MSTHAQILDLRLQEKKITSQILEALQVFEEGREYLDLGFSSLFDYLVRALGYSESTAYQRQACIRLTRQLPEVKAQIDSGALSAASVSAAYKHIKKEKPSKQRKILKRIEGKSSREVQKMLAQPQPVKLRETEYQDRTVLRLELSPAQAKKWQKLKALKSHLGSAELLFEALLDKFLREFAGESMQSSRSKNSRYVGRRLRNAVLKRAGYKCEHPNCESTHFLQIDHIIPVRKGGGASPENLQVLCQAHNLRKA